MAIPPTIKITHQQVFTSSAHLSTEPIVLSIVELLLYVVDSDALKLASTFALILAFAAAAAYSVVMLNAGMHILPKSDLFL